MGIRLKDLSKLGYRDNVARSLVVDIVSKHCKYYTKEQIEMCFQAFHDSNWQTQFD